MNHAITDVVVMILIVASIVLLVVEITEDHVPTKRMLRVVNEAIVFVFIIELTLRYLAENKKRRFFANYWLDIISVIPLLRALRVLRVFRLLRVFRFGLKLSRQAGWISGPIQKNAAKSFGVFMTILILVLFGGFGLRVAEQNNSPLEVDEALWMTIMSLVAGEPIGAVPETPLGRMIVLIVMIAGLVIFAALTGVISAVMVTRLNALHTPLMDIDELENHIVVCGWNRSGLLLLTEFQQDPETAHRAIVVVGEFQGPPTWRQTMKRPELIYTLTGDFTRLEVLEQAGLDRAAHAIVLADQIVNRSEQDRDARTVLAALLIERINKGIFTSVQLLNRDNAAFLSMVGVEEVVVAEEYAACIIASATKNEGIVPMFDELLTSRYGNQIYKFPVPGSLDGKTVQDAGFELKSKHDATVIGVEEDRRALGSEARMLLNPPGERVIHLGEQLVVIAMERPRFKS